jgi:glycosyltransferase involved in cell wall biosynthesis
MPRLSVVLNFYNHARYLPAAVASVRWVDECQGLG